MASPAHVLIVEDDPHVLTINRRTLEREGYTVAVATTLAEARLTLASTRPDVILLDVMLPDGDGVAFARDIRPHTDAHVIFLTARIDTADIINGLAAGGDDYITKPYALQELVARVAAAVRRRAMAPAPAEAPTPNRMKPVGHGWIQFDRLSLAVTIGGARIELTPKEFGVLTVLAAAPRRAHTASELYESAWHRPMLGSPQAIRTVLSRLRGKLEPHGLTIAGARGEGYELKLRA
ncbi:MAG: response regulator transcription factor [Bifidobacteriaceae bacterium]|jgi:two-component system OmpR family response regulator|nr:response regulator transcription factor [Bifidobacteriaceae bacterium]